jgi:hypothetical protein
MKTVLLGLLAAIAFPAMAQTVGPTEALLEWDYATSNVTFIVERKSEACSPTGDWEEVATLPGTARSRLEISLTPGTSYCWRLYAQNAVGRSAPSAMVGKSIQALPSAPTNVRVQ